MPGPKITRHKHRPVFNNPPQVLSADGAVDISHDGSALITKGSAAAITVAAPGAKNIGRRKTITSGSDFAHVVTFNLPLVQIPPRGPVQTTPVPSD